jgi:hypothetical protein
MWAGGPHLTVARNESSAAAGALATLILCAPLLSAWPALADEGPAVSGSTAFNSERKVEVAPDGAIFVTFVDIVNNTTTVFVKQSLDAGATWTRLPALSRNESFRSALAIDSRGTVHVAWSELAGVNRQVFYARWQGGPAWLATEQLSHTPGYSGFPALAVDAQDRLHLVWYGFDGTNYQVFYTWRQAGGAWADAVQAAHGAKDANNPAIALGPDGQVHVAYFTYVRGETDVWYMVGGPGGWSVPQRVNGEGESAVRPSLVVRPDGTACVAWVGQSNSTTYVDFAQRSASGNWSASQRVSGNDSGADNPSLTASSAGDLAVFFETAAGSIRVATQIHGAWHGPVTLASAPGNRWPSASWSNPTRTSNQTAVLVVWTLEGAGTSRLQFARVDFFPPPACPCAAPDADGLLRWGLAVGVGAAAALTTGLVLYGRRQRG